MKGNHRRWYTSACGRTFLGLESFVLLLGVRLKRKEAAQKPFCPSSSIVRLAEKCHSGRCRERESERKKKMPRRQLTTHFMRRHRFCNLVSGRLDREDQIRRSCSDRQGGKSSCRARRRNIGQRQGNQTRHQTPLTSLK